MFFLFVRQIGENDETKFIFDIIKEIDSAFICRSASINSNFYNFADSL